MNVSTGIKKAQAFDQNLEAVKASILTNGWEAVRERLENMKVFFWVGHEFDGCGCIVCDIIGMLEAERNPDGLNEEIREAECEAFDKISGGYWKAEPAKVEEYKTRW